MHGVHCNDKTTNILPYIALLIPSLCRYLSKHFLQFIQNVPTHLNLKFSIITEIVGSSFSHGVLTI